MTNLSAFRRLLLSSLLLLGTLVSHAQGVTIGASQAPSGVGRTRANAVSVSSSGRTRSGWVRRKRTSTGADTG